MSDSWTHPWCKSPARDEAVRASEDGRPGPLPTLEEAIERQKHAAMTAGVKEGFVKADGEWKRLTDDELRQLFMIPKTASASSAVEPENKGNGMRPPTTKTATVENDFAEPAECSPSLSKTGEGQSGLRTERIVLEIQTHSPLPVSEWGWQEIVEDSNVKMVAFSVRVVEDQRESHLSHLEAQRGVIDTLTRQRDAAIRERDELRARVDYLWRDRRFWCFQSSTHEQAANVLRARVAELESAAKLAPAANADAVSNPRPISGAGKSAGEETQAASGAAGTGWLTAEERGSIQHAANIAKASWSYSLAQELENLLARSSPPEVVLPALPPYAWSNAAGPKCGWDDCMGIVRYALAAAGVTVKEVGRE